MGSFFLPLPTWFATKQFSLRGDPYPNMRGFRLWDRGPLMLRGGGIEPMGAKR